MILNSLSVFLYASSIFLCKLAILRDAPSISGCFLLIWYSSPLDICASSSTIEHISCICLPTSFLVSANRFSISNTWCWLYSRKSRICLVDLLFDSWMLFSKFSVSDFFKSFSTLSTFSKIRSWVLLIIFGISLEIYSWSFLQNSYCYRCCFSRVVCLSCRRPICYSNSCYELFCSDFLSNCISSMILYDFSWDFRRCSMSSRRRNKVEII